MPTTITDVSTFTTPVLGPAGGEARTAASVLTGLQALANRTAYINDRLVAGITHLRDVADAAALRAISTHANGDVAALQGGNNGRVFIYDAASTKLDDGVLVVKPTDVGGGAGRWLNPAVALLGASPSFTGTVGFVDVSCSGAATAQGNISTQGDLFASGDLTCTIGYVTTLTCSGAASVGGNLTVTGDVNAGGDLFASGGLTCVVGAFSGAVTCASTLAVTGGTTLGNSLGVSGLATFTTGITFASAGTIRHRKSIGDDGNHTYAIADAEHVFVKALTANRTYTLSNTGAVDGMRMMFTNINAIYTITIDAPEESDIAVIGGGGSAPRGAFFVFSAGRWERAL